MITIRCASSAARLDPARSNRAVARRTARRPIISASWVCGARARANGSAARSERSSIGPASHSATCAADGCPSSARHRVMRVDARLMYARAVDVLGEVARRPPPTHTDGRWVWLRLVLTSQGRTSRELSVSSLEPFVAIVFTAGAGFPLEGPIQQPPPQVSRCSLRWCSGRATPRPWPGVVMVRRAALLALVMALARSLAAQPVGNDTAGMRGAPRLYPCGPPTLLGVWARVRSRTPSEPSVGANGDWGCC